MSKEWKVVKHGTNYIDISSPIICPECGNLIEKVSHIEKKSGEWFFFDIFRKYWSEERCTCQRCNCEVSRQINKKLEVDWSELLGFIMILFLIISIIALCVFIPLFCVKGGLAYLISLMVSAGTFVISLIVAAIIMNS